MAGVDSTFSLLLVCPDRKGIVAAVAGFLSEHDASIVEAKQFNDQLTGRFYSVSGMNTRRSVSRKSAAISRPSCWRAPCAGTPSGASCWMGSAA